MQRDHSHQSEFCQKLLSLMYEPLDGVNVGPQSSKSLAAEMHRYREAPQVLDRAYPR